MSALSKRWRGLLGTLLATGTIAGFAAVAAAPSAHAAFPGTNGPVVFQNSATGDLDTLNPSTGVVSVFCPSAVCGAGVLVMFAALWVALPRWLKATR